MSDPDDWEYIIDAMVDVTRSDHGTARSMRWRSPNIIAGKTGTSQVFSRSRDADPLDMDDLLYELRNHGLFIGFAPPDRPRIAIGVIV
jgi:penicillin-binding protein 2